MAALVASTGSLNLRDKNKVRVLKNSPREILK